MANEFNVKWYWCSEHGRAELKHEAYPDCRQQGPFDSLDEAIEWSLPEAFD